MDPLTFEKSVLVKYPFFFPLTLNLDIPKIIIIMIIIITIIIIIIIIHLIWICHVHSLQHNPYK